MKPAEEIIGVVGFSTMSVRPGDTAVAMGIGDLPIVSQSHLLNMMEHAAVTAIVEFLESGETTIFANVAFAAVSPANIGAELQASARCISIAGKDLLFECEVYEGEKQIAVAQLKRTAVERVSFLARTAAQSLIS